MSNFILGKTQLAHSPSITIILSEIISYTDLIYFDFTKHLSQSISFIDSTGTSKDHGLTDTIVYIERLTKGFIHTYNLTDALTFTQHAPPDRQYTLFSHISYNNILAYQKYLPITIAEKLLFVEGIFAGGSHHTISIKETFHIIPQIRFGIGGYAAMGYPPNLDNPTLSFDKFGQRIVGAGGAIFRPPGIFMPGPIGSSGIGDTGPVSGNYLIYNDVIVTKIEQFVILSTGSVNIVLPPPIWNDTINVGTTITSNYSVDGNRYTYVKRTGRYVLKYTFELRKDKAQELMAFLNNAVFTTFSMHNFKGEIWQITLKNNPIFTAFSRGTECPASFEYYTIDLEFDGIRII